MNFDINSMLQGKKPKNNKIFFIIGGVILAAVIVVGAMMLLPKNDEVETIVPEITLSQEEIAKKEKIDVITQGLSIGTAKEVVIQRVGATEEYIGKNYVINPNYTRIGKYDFLSAFIFNNDVLVAIVHERMLDGSQKHNLAVEYQKFSAEIGELYTLIDSKEDWFSTELIYDADTWNAAIVDNDLELYSNFENEETKEYLTIVASGINYFDFLALDREMLSVGNLNLIYTSSVYKDDFLGFVSLAAEK